MPAKLTVAKIVSTATPTAWSQAYHAGGFTAVISISHDKQTSDSDLQAIGKKLLDTLIAEYFTLLKKDLTTVKGAVSASIEKLPDGITLSMVVGASVQNVLYIVVVNHGKALLKRGDKAGVLLELENEGEKKEVASVSGYLEHGDIIVLQTKDFEDVIPQHELIGLIDHQSPEDLAEIVSPKIHEAQNGGAAAIIFLFHEEEPTLLQSYAPPVEEKKEERHMKFLDEQETESPEPAMPSQEMVQEDDSQKEHEEKEEDTPQKKEEEKIKEPEVQEIPSQQNHTFLEEKPHEEELSPLSHREQVSFQRSEKKGISHSQRLFLTIAIIITVVLGSSIFFFLSKQDEAKHQEIFNAVYDPAKTKYDEGIGLLDLNKPLALSDLQQAKDMITTGESKLPSDSTQHKKLQDLLSQVTTSLQKASQTPTIQTPKAADNASPLLTFASKHTDALYVAQDTTNFYTADNATITSYNKASGASKQLVKNISDWKLIGGLGTYLGNIYVLDKSDGIVKYVNGTSKQSYFSGTTPNFSKAVSMAIDRSIWVLSSDGTILKFTRGEKDDFSMSGLAKPFNNPTSIVTTVDDSNLYILDKGNSRVVVIKKTGEFVNEYQADVIKNADGLDVDEAGKKIYILSAGTIYQLEMK